MSRQHNIIGWDIGGAHLKAAVVNSRGTVVQVVQRPCPLWQGIQELVRAVQEILSILPECTRHALTMTGELADLFSTRKEGVDKIIGTMSELLGASAIRVFAGTDEFLHTAAVDAENYTQIASANWLASTNYLTKHTEAALFVDIGSTTSDILIIADGQLRAQGHNDFQRLRHQELVYTGVVRTPVMAVCSSALFDGSEVGLMAEYFATMADVYRLTNELEASHDQAPAADNGEKTVAASGKRLARMLGCDYQASEHQRWRQFALNIRRQQLNKILHACEQQISRALLPESFPLVGAGVGRFLVKELAWYLNCPYQDFNELFPRQGNISDMSIADCAPAVCVAWLALNSA